MLEDYIDGAVYQVIWNYVSNAVNIIGENAKSDDDIKYIITQSENTNLELRNLEQRIGLKDDTEECALQAVVHIAVAIADWLEIDLIQSSEIIATFKIIYPPDLQFNLTPINGLENVVVSAFALKQLLISNDSVRLVASILNNVSSIKESSSFNSRRIINRFMSFSLPV
jgi:hypothetical protein